MAIVKIDKEILQQNLAQRQVAYKQVQKGANTLLAVDVLFWTERLLLRLTRKVVTIRLKQVAELVPDGEYVAAPGNCGSAGRGCAWWAPA